MNAVDTNVLVRFLTDDDPEQSARARRLFEAEQIFLSLTVLLEAFWVLRKHRKLTSSVILRQLVLITRLPQVTLEDAPRFERTMALAEAGMDFADAMHLTATPSGMRFATFDQDLIRFARRSDVADVFAP